MKQEEESDTSRRATRKRRKIWKKKHGHEVESPKQVQTSSEALSQMIPEGVVSITNTDTIYVCVLPTFLISSPATGLHQLPGLVGTIRVCATYVRSTTALAASCVGVLVGS